MTLRPRTVLVTGGAGFIGSELVRQLVEANCRTTVVDNLVNGKRENLSDFPKSRCRLVVADIRDPGVAKLLRNVDIVFHLAALGVRHSIHSPEENHEVNATATLRLLKSARKAGVGRFVYVSSSEIYGTARWVPITEDCPPFPMTVYGASKLAGDSYTRAFWETYRYPTVVVRPFNAFGPRCHHEGDSGEVIPKFLLRCMTGRPMVVFGDGRQTRDFTYVSDSARGILLAGWAGCAVGQTINVGNGREISVNDLARQVKFVAGRPGARVVHDKPRPGDVRRLWADPARAKKLLGFKPRVSLREGLMKLKDWYLSQGRTLEQLMKEEVVRNWIPEKGGARASRAIS